MVSGLLMSIMAIAVSPYYHGNPMVPESHHTPADPVQSGPPPKALADEIKRNEEAYYLHGMNDAVEFWRLTGSPRHFLITTRVMGTASGFP